MNVSVRGPDGSSVAVPERYRPVLPYLLRGVVAGAAVFVSVFGALSWLVGWLLAAGLAAFAAWCVFLVTPALLGFRNRVEGDVRR